MYITTAFLDTIHWLHVCNLAVLIKFLEICFHLSVKKKNQKKNSIAMARDCKKCGGKYSPPTGRKCTKVVEESSDFVPPAGHALNSTLSSILEDIQWMNERIDSIEQHQRNDHVIGVPWHSRHRQSTNEQHWIWPLENKWADGQQCKDVAGKVYTESLKKIFRQNVSKQDSKK